MNNKENRKIITSLIFPPIPNRNFDYAAYYDGTEETMEYGWGKTKEEAIANLLEYYPEEEKEEIAHPYLMIVFAVIGILSGIASIGFIINAIIYHG